MSVCQNIKAVAEVRGISIKELSRRVDIPYTTLYNMLNRDSERFDLNLLEQIRWNINELHCAQRGANFVRPLSITQRIPCAPFLR